MIFTPDTILKTREFYAAQEREYVGMALNGSVKVKDIHAYIARRKEIIERALSGYFDNETWFKTMATRIQNGEPVEW